ncbi:MAG: EAL domain-containing protein [Erythrobacter sp.]|uniref:EAL domain-containing protein n=1 Tax=Erythrobacter sp. TaxID=1042 RepID=UPI002635E80A|nr:EAL domain-containing protein [Erythrobacter sp.]MDJ0977931.1 EAL domain-containing protein [Erythrobacter sp.]
MVNRPLRNLPEARVNPSAASAGAARDRALGAREASALYTVDPVHLGSKPQSTTTPDSPAKTPFIERRSVDRDRRRSHPDDRATAGEALFESHYYLPQDQRGLALFMLLAFLIAGGVARTIPTPLALVAAGASIALILLGAPFAKLERRAETPDKVRHALMVIGIMLPMALAGYAFANWVIVGLPWQWAVASLVCINAASAALYRARIVAMFTAKISIWAAFALVHPSALTVSAVIGAALALGIIARFEWTAAERRRLASEARERVAARAEDILRSFEETGQGWFWETDRRGLISYISPAAAKVIGMTVDALHGQPLTMIVDQDARASDAERTLGFHLSARSAFRDIEVLAANSGEEERFWSLTGRPVYDTFNNFCGFRGHGTDLTEKRRSEQQVTRLAHYDSLTGLANRVQMSEALEQILAAPRERDRACTVLMLDLDRFKQVNDTMGHPAGDALLKQVAQRLERVLDGIGRCGRLGGDEFQVIIPGYANREALVHVAKQIIQSLSQPYSIDGHSVVIGASVGVAIAPDDGTTSEDLIRNVDLALYAAKDAGRGVHCFYAEDLHSAAEERAELEQELREAIQTGGLSLYYQPVVYAATEKIVGFEALMRWNHPKRGFISPEKFIPIAEDAGLIDQMGQWALRTACADLARWPDTIRCAVNVSPLQFSNLELATHVANALAHAGVEPARLELEITESVFLNDSSGTDAMFKALKRVGVRLALDDFGTGYSSLGYLKKAPFDKIKIDQSFVRGATEDGSRNGAIIASITSLAEALSMDTTAEGVETLDELELIRLLGCSHVQGYIYHQPLDAEEATELVRGNLAAQAEGPRAARHPRQVLLRRVTIIHRDNRLTANIRNISDGGALVEGLWNMPVGSAIRIEFSPGKCVEAQVRWSRENRVGVEFRDPLRRRADGTFAMLHERPQVKSFAGRGGI